MDSITDSLSVPDCSSRTAFLETTTLFLFLSILITFTRLLTKPLTISPSSIASSRSIQACNFLALSLDRIVEPYPSSNFSIATLTKSPTATSISPLSLKNSSVLITLSDFKPALTITKSLSTDITSAVITSP